MTSSAETVTRFFAAIADGDEERFLACFAPDAVAHDPYGRPPSEGHEGLRAFFAGITDTFSSMVLTPTSTFVNGDRVAVAWTGEAVAKDGATASYEGIDVFELDGDGLITRLDAYWNPRALFAQLQA